MEQSPWFALLIIRHKWETKNADLEQNSTLVAEKQKREHKYRKNLEIIHNSWQIGAVKKQRIDLITDFFVDLFCTSKKLSRKSLGTKS